MKLGRDTSRGLALAAASPRPARAAPRALFGSGVAGRNGRGRSSGPAAPWAGRCRPNPWGRRRLRTRTCAGSAPARIGVGVGEHVPDVERARHRGRRRVDRRRSRPAGGVGSQLWVPDSCQTRSQRASGRRGVEVFGKAGRGRSPAGRREIVGLSEPMKDPFRGCLTERKGGSIEGAPLGPSGDLGPSPMGRAADFRFPAGRPCGEARVGIASRLPSPREERQKHGQALPGPPRPAPRAADQEAR